MDAVLHIFRSIGGSEIHQRASTRCHPSRICQKFDELVKALDAGDGMFDDELVRSSKT